MVLSFGMLSLSAAEGGICCLGCGGITVCGSEVSGECGSCSGGGYRDHAEREPEFDLKISMESDRPQSYKIKESESLIIGSEKREEKFRIQPRLNSENLVEIDVKKIYSIFGWQISVAYATIQVNRGTLPEAPLRLGSFSIWSAEYHPRDKSNT